MPIFMEKVVRAWRRDIIGVAILSPTFRSESWFSFIRRQWGFYGLKDFFLEGSYFVLYKVLDLVSKVIPQKRFYSVEKLCQGLGLPTYRVKDVNSVEFLAELRELAPDVIVSAAAPQVFKRPLLKLPRLGCINIHSGLLPKYRGWLPTFWVLANDEQETGVTVHFMGKELDDGDIILQQRVPITAEDTLHSLIAKCKVVGAELLVAALDQMEAGTVIRKPNPQDEATYYSFPTKVAVRRFRARGRRFR